MMTNKEETSKKPKEAVDYEKSILADIEVLGEEMPTASFMKTAEELDELMKRLDRAYDEREKVIDRIMTEGSGFESRKALRMLSTPLLKEWAEEIEHSHGLR
jgi:hypothetical protein